MNFVVVDICCVCCYQLCQCGDLCGCLKMYVVCCYLCGVVDWFYCCVCEIWCGVFCFDDGGVIGFVEGFQVIVY